MEADLLKQFYKTITEIANHGDAREESFYSSLEKLLYGYASRTGRRDIHVRTLPKKTDAGNPDFRIWNGIDRITGYIEAKQPLETNLNNIESSEQLKRYRSIFPNLILTNFFEFRLYRKGALVETVLAARPFIPFQLNQIPPVEKGDELLSLLDKFFSFTMPREFTAESLATELAKRTRFLRDIIQQEMQVEEKEGARNLTGFYEAFRDYLIAHLNREDFADLYSQTVTYGLFAARTRAKRDFSRKTAYDYIPNTIGILKEVFQFVSLGTLPEQLEWIIDEIAQVLAVAEPGAILDRFYHEGRGADPLVHFYETFLKKYDPKERELRGVYYTPPPVVSYIVRSLNHLLKKSFSKANGLASDGVTLLDPAAGTMTFVAKASVEALKEQENAFGSGGNDKFIRSHILENFYAFELMMAPYAVGHLKMSFILEELGHQLTDNERFKFYLTNTLEMEELAQTNLPVVRSLAQESHLAGKVKKDQPILVILGNPPYSGISANAAEMEVEFKKGEDYISHYDIQEKNGAYVPVRVPLRARRDLTKMQKTWIGELIETYKIIDGEWFGERKHWLQDDYVKFLRFAQWKIDQLGQGVVGMITNHSYLDNPTFRGMRQSLMQTYDEIYILDLHGNSLKKEKAPDGGVDKNVFDIRQGVAIAFFVNLGKKNGGALARVYHADLWGLRESKYRWLETRDISTTDWNKLTPDSPYYFFVPRDESGRKTYEHFMQVTDIFPVNVTGIVTARDKFVIDIDRRALESRIMTFRNKKLPDEIVQKGLGLKENYQWRVSKAREQLIKVENWEDYFTKILYRPFDARHIYFHDSVVWRTRKEVMRHMLAGHNLGLIAMRQVSLDEDYSHFLVTANVIDNRIFASSKGIGQLFPLHLHPDANKHNLFPAVSAEKTEANLNPRLTAALASAYGKEPSPEEIFQYIYAVLYAPAYRERYGEFLKTDFPRVPFTKDTRLFQSLAELGQQLVDLHLLRSKKLDQPGVRFDGNGENRVAQNKSKGFRFHPEEGRVYINPNQYFHLVPPEVWTYQIGGYQVLQKWLKDRKGRELSLEDIRHYCRVARALQLTIELQQQIDNVYKDIEKNLLDLELPSKR